MDGTGSEIRRNEAQVAGNIGTYTAAPLTGDFTVNARNSTDGHAGMVGDFAEFFFLSLNPSVDERQKIEGYLAHKWALNGNLATDHPYKFGTP
jgi:hypothetical protein